MARHLPAEFLVAVNHYFNDKCLGTNGALGRPDSVPCYFISAARDYKGNVLLEVHGPGLSMFGKFLVYSPRRQCIVGTFAWGIQM